MARTASRLKRRRVRPSLLWLGVWAAVGAMIGVLLSILSGNGRASARVMEIVVPVSLGVGAFIVLSVLLAVLVHELGHVLAGTLAGFEFRSMMVGPFELRRERGHGRLRIGLVENRKASGNARMVPRETDRLVSRMLLFVAGGPLASLVWCGFSYAIFRAVPAPRHDSANGALALHLGAVCLLWMSVSVLPGTLVPFQTASGVSTDMRVILTLVRPHPSRERLVAMILMGREILAGQRPREWSEELVRLSTGLRDNSADELRAWILSYYRADDAGATDEARRDLERAVELARHLGKRRGIQGDAAMLEWVYTAATEGDLSSAEQRLEEAGETSEAIGGTYARAKASVLVLRGDHQAAREQLELAESKLREYLRRYGGSIDYDLEKVEELRRRLPARA